MISCVCLAGQPSVLKGKTFSTKFFHTCCSPIHKHHRPLPVKNKAILFKLGMMRLTAQLFVDSDLSGFDLDSTSQGC